MEINIGMSECHKNVDNYYGSHITVWIPRCAGREAFDGVEPLHGFTFFIVSAELTICLPVKLQIRQYWQSIFFLAVCNL